MKINENKEIKFEDVHMNGAKNVKMQILIGTEGQSAFVIPNELHQCRNPYDEDFEIICIIPNQKKS